MKYLLSLLIIFACLSCSKETSVNIRLKNVSNSTFESATYNSVEYGELSPNQFSEYKLFERSYRYGHFTIVVDGQTFELIPIDYVGEEPLKSGDYTFELSFSGTGLGYELIED